MAAKRRVPARRTVDEFPVMENEAPVVQTTPRMTSNHDTSGITKKPIFWVLLPVALLVVWWWRTNTWPVMAVVGGKPIFRHEVDKALYSQYGDRTVQGMVTQYQIEEALNKKNVAVSDKEVDDKINEIKTRLPAGTDFDAELKNQGLTAQSLRDLLAIQLRLNKVAEGQASVSAEEITAYIKDNSKMMTATTEAERKVEAEQTVKQDKLNSVINTFVEEAQKSGSIWWWPTYKQATPSPAPTPAS